MHVANEPLPAGARVAASRAAGPVARRHPHSVPIAVPTGADAFVATLFIAGVELRT
jgi:hypothetical protein